MAEGPGGQEHHIPIEAVQSLVTRRLRTAGPQVGNGSTTIPDMVAPESNNRQTTSDEVDAPRSTQGFNHASGEAVPSSGVDATDLQPIQRAREMAEYTERLLAPWRQRAEEQAEQVGRLTAELEQAKRQIAAFEAATDELEHEREATIVEATHRPWWRFWG